MKVASTASIINWMLEVEDVNGASCAVNYMKKMEVFKVDNLVFRVKSGQREWRGGREKRGLGYV